MEFRTVWIVARALRCKLSRIPKSGDSAYFGSGERKKRDVGAENIFDGAAPCADETSSPVVCCDGVGKRGKRLAFQRHEYLCSRLNPSQVNC